MIILTESVMSSVLCFWSHCLLSMSKPQRTKSQRQKLWWGWENSYNSTPDQVGVLFSQWTFISVTLSFTKSVKNSSQVEIFFSSKYYFYISDLSCYLFLQIKGVVLRCWLEVMRPAVNRDYRIRWHTPARPTLNCTGDFRITDQCVIWIQGDDKLNNPW